jgi:hypothetical protein
MPSHTRRRGLERVAQGVGLGCLALLAFGRPGEAPPVTVRAAELSGALQAATTRPTAALHVELDAPPGPAERAWARALRVAGSRISWRADSSIAPVAISVDPIGTPRGGLAWRALAPRGAEVRDTVGTLWRTEEAGAVEATTLSASALAVVTGRHVARPPEVDAAAPTQRVRVVGRAGWEPRFVAEALRAAGWVVEVDFTVTAAPSPVGVRTATGRAPLDTATHAAVVLVGGDAVAPARLKEFVRAGGGLVLLGEAIGHPAATELRPAVIDGELPPTPGALATEAPRRALKGWRLRPRHDGVVIEAREASAVVVGRREHLGRVLAVGYDETWRWQMEGTEGSDVAYARWWSGLVASVSRARGVPPTGPGDPAPLASWHAALGGPGAPPPSPILARWDDRWLVGLALLGFVSAWLSRRLRGLP